MIVGSPVQRHKQFSRQLVWIFFTVALFQGTIEPRSLRAVEPWSDSSLPVTQGLQLWLDMARQPQARAAQGYPPLGKDDALGFVLDGSGHGRHFGQTHQESQPRWSVWGKTAAAEFDGENDCLTLSGQRLKYASLTMFLVAAPRSNPGGYRAFFAMNQLGRNDYTSGLTIDQSAFGSPAWDRLNPEGQGFGGAVDLMQDVHPFNTLHTVAIVADAANAKVSLYVDGKLNGQRPRTSTEGTEIHELSLGARCYSNTREPPFLSGFLDGYVCELLVYDQALNPQELQAVDKYLAARHAEAAKQIVQQPPDGTSVRLVQVENPPPVQMFVPGFSVRELPLKLTNINNVKYRSDGKLVAVGYDGRIWLLSDTDHDGIEDRANSFWDRGALRSPIGMALTPPNYPHGQGVFVASKGKVSLIVDQNGDERADREIVLAEGWEELPHGVDALGVAVASDGSVFFGLGAANFTNAYLIENGKARYDLSGERGTVMRITPDFKTREIYSTGIRFPVAMAFNEQEDLFTTDQEGATWLPNGNPLDELLHIKPDRHYGFPPRHPTHLPNVIDEPSVFDYTPQHQSTCGLNFNRSPDGQMSFGPAWWRDDALVCGYSRGKLYRTKLVKTEHGYVAQNALLGCVNMLPVDACVSPSGDLVLAAHSGHPDWGSGPQGDGKLYKITYAESEAPQPVLTWAAGPQEVRLAFDRPLEPQTLQGLAARINLEYGEHVRAGDRFESLRPGYQVVQDQLAAPRRKLPVHGVSISPDRRTLLVTTDPHPQSVHYAMTLTGHSPMKVAPPNLPQHDAMDLDYSLHGVEATWRSEQGDSITTWLPHLDLNVARRLTSASEEHRRFFEQIRQPGQLTLRTKANVFQLLRPAVQPGAQIDYEWPVESPRLNIHSKQLLRGASTPEPWAVVRQTEQEFEVAIQGPAPADRRLPLEVVLETSPSEVELTVSFSTNEDARRRAIQLTRFYLPWAPEASAADEPPPRTLPAELAGGDWLQGREVFYQGQGQCAACHTIDGRGGQVGPDLSNLRQRDYASVLRDISTPSAAINPEFVTYAVRLVDGRVLTGAVRTEGDQLHVAYTTPTSTGTEIKQTTVAKDDVEELQPLAASVMPDGVVKTLGEPSLKHLLTFLLAPPPEELQPAPIVRPGAPPPRKRAEVQTILDVAKSNPTDASKPLRILLVAGPKDHGENEHDYPQWQKRWSKLLSLGEKVQVTTADVWPTADEWQGADVAVFYSANPAWAPDKAKEVDDFQQRGGGLVFLHYAVNGDRAPEELAERIGLAWRGGMSKFRHGEVTLDLAPAAGHPLVAGLPPKLDFTDESYWQLVGDPKKINILATGVEDGQPQPLLWTYERGQGRVFVSILGHYSWTFDDPMFRVLVLRAIAWTAHQPPDRLSELALPGARLSP
jgi:putative heme-binding domain-containing protein